MRPDELRPRRHWYWVAAAVAVLGLVGAAVGTALLARSAAGLASRVEQLDPQLRPLLNGRPTAIELDPAQDWAIYVAGSGRAPVSCGGDGLTTTGVARETTLTRDGTTWQQVLLVRATEPGQREITCSATDRTADLALGRAVDADAAARARAELIRVVLAALAVVGFGGAGVLVGCLIALVVAMRRASNRASLGRRPY